MFRLLGTDSFLQIPLPCNLWLRKGRGGAGGTGLGPGAEEPHRAGGRPEHGPSSGPGRTRGWGSEGEGRPPLPAQGAVSGTRGSGRGVVRRSGRGRRRGPGGRRPRPAGSRCPSPGRVAAVRSPQGRRGRAEVFRVPVTRAVGADDTGESSERTNDLVAPPRLKVLHDQDLQVTHGCAFCASGASSHEGGKSAGRASRNLARRERAHGERCAVP